jgi:uncharacterized OB-fold protein/putative sterol carrier protein
MSEFFGTTVEDIFNTMPARFKPEKAEGLDITIGYKCGGKGQWKVVVQERKLKVAQFEGKLSGCDFIINAKDAETFIGTTLGKINATNAMKTGELKIDGDIKLMKRVLPKIFTPYSVPDQGKKEAEELLSIKVINSIEQRFASGPVMGMWFAGLKEKKILANKCPQCGRTQVPPREICANCRIRVADFVEVGPKGTVTNIENVYYASPDPLTGAVRDTPYMVLFVMLDGASEEESVSAEFLNKEDFKKVKLGTRVCLVWVAETTGNYNDLLGFKLDE